MTDLTGILLTHTVDGTTPGAVALIDRGGTVEQAAVGTADAEGTAPLAPDAIFRLASITKPVTAAATMLLVDEGRLGLDDAVERWLPELAERSVVRTYQSPVDDTVPAARPITVRDLLTFRSGYGFAADFSLPALVPLSTLHRDILNPPLTRPTDEWLRELAAVPLLAQPGTAWLYHTSAEILGPLVERVTGTGFADFLAERILTPLAMPDTGFSVPPAAADRLVPMYRRTTPDGPKALDEVPAAAWTVPPAFASGAGGLVGTAADMLAFGRMLAAGGLAADGRRLLSEKAVAQLNTNVLTPAERAPVDLYLEGAGWGFGGSVDVERRFAWNVPGRYGWVGGSGTAFHVLPDGTVTVLLTQVTMTGPTTLPIMRDFWRYAALR